MYNAILSAYTIHVRTYVLVQAGSSLAFVHVQLLSLGGMQQHEKCQ